MKMIIAIVNDSDSVKLITSLIEDKFQVTKLATTGGFLKIGNTTILVGAEDDKVEQVLNIIETNCQSRDEVVSSISPLGGHSDAFITLPIEVKVGGATVFVCPVEQFCKF